MTTPAPHKVVIGNAELWLGDCRDVLPLLADESVDIILTVIPQIDDHPTPKPVELFDHFLALHGKPGDLVLDPFMGHSPVGVAALRAGMRYIGIECDAEHFDAAVRRLQNAHAQQALFAPVVAAPAMPTQTEIFA